MTDTVGADSDKLNDVTLDLEAVKPFGNLFKTVLVRHFDVFDLSAYAAGNVIMFSYSVFISEC